MNKADDQIVVEKDEISSQQKIAVINKVKIDKKGIIIDYCIYENKTAYNEFRGELSFKININYNDWKGTVYVNDIIEYIKEKFKKYNNIYINNGANDRLLDAICKSIENPNSMEDFKCLKNVIVYDITGMGSRKRFPLFLSSWNRRVEEAAYNAKMATVISDKSIIEGKTTDSTSQYRQELKPNNPCYTMKPTAEVPTTSRGNLKKNGINAWKNDILK